MRIPLIWKLLLVNALLVVLVMGVIWLAIDHQASAYFMTLMKKYEISPTEVHGMFLSATHRALLWTCIAALAIAFVLSFLLTRRILGPLARLDAVMDRVAGGDSSARLEVTSRDEVGRLTRSFNDMAEALERMELLRRTMVIDVAHELRTPLTNMRGYLEALKDGVLAPSPALFSSLHEESLRLSRLVSDLLESARARSSGRELQKRPIDLARLNAKLLRAFRKSFEARELEVSAAVAERAQVVANPDGLVRIYRNLLRNAVQYTPRGGRVRIEITTDESGARLEFTNTGVEIPEQDLPLIFECFYRGEKSRSRSHGGAGIGLAIVKSIVEAHGGQVGAASEGGVTRIWFTLPYA